MASLTYSGTALTAMPFASITVAIPAQATRPSLSPGSSRAHSAPAHGRGFHLPPLSEPPLRRLLFPFSAFLVSLLTAV